MLSKTCTNVDGGMDLRLGFICHVMRSFLLLRGSRTWRCHIRGRISDGIQVKGFAMMETGRSCCPHCFSLFLCLNGDQTQSSRYHHVAECHCPVNPILNCLSLSMLKQCATTS